MRRTRRGLPVRCRARSRRRLPLRGSLHGDRMLSSWRRRGSRRAGALRKLPNRTYHSRPPAASHGFQRERRHSGTYPSMSACRCGSKTAAASGGKRPWRSGRTRFRACCCSTRSVRRDHPATREKDLGIWQTWTWAQVAAEVRALACGLAAQGFKRGMHLAIIGDNRPRLYWSMIAAQALGGVPVPMYQDAPAAEFVYVLNDAEIAYAIVEDQEQVDKLLEAQPQVPTLAHIYLRRSARPAQLRGRDELRRGCRRSAANSIARIRASSTREVAQGRAGRRVGHALHVGHHRQAQGRVPDARGVHRRGAAAAASSTSSTPDDSILSYLPMAWVGDHLFSYAQWLVAGFTINCPESGDTVMTDLREIGPTYYFAPPRVFENLLTQVMIRMEDASAHQALAVPPLHGRRAPLRRRDPRRQAGVARATALQYALGNLLVYGAAAQRARHEPHPRRLHRGRRDRPRPVPLLPLDRHQPEAALRLDRDLRVRLPAARRRRQVRHRRACRRPASRSRSPTTAKCWCAGRCCSRSTTSGPMRPPSRSTPTATSTPATPASSTTTGSSRSSTAPRTSASSPSGAMFAPNYIENKLKFFPHIKEAVAFGNGRDQRVRVHQHRHGLGRQLGRAPRHRLFGLHRSRARSPRCYELDPRVRREGQRRARRAKARSPHSQVHRFLILHKELDPDDDELTRTRKVRRGFVAEKYAVLIDALYGGQDVAAHRDAGEVRGRPHAAWSPPTCAIDEREDACRAAAAARRPEARLA